MLLLPLVTILTKWHHQYQPRFLHISCYFWWFYTLSAVGLGSTTWANKIVVFFISWKMYARILMLHIIFLMKICSNQKPLKMNHLVMTLKISKLELTIQIFFYTTHTKIGFSVEVKKQNKKQIQKKKII